MDNTKMMGDFSSQRSTTYPGAYEVVDNSKLFKEDGSFNDPSAYTIADNLPQNKARYLSRKLNNERDGSNRNKKYQENFNRWFVEEFLVNCNEQ